MVRGREEGAEQPESVVDALRRLIVSGELSSHSALSESALAQSFGVSRTPIREALKRLQTEGLVEIRPRVGTFIREPSNREVVELFDVKEMLEGLAARLLAVRGRVLERDQLEENVARSREAVAASEHAKYAELVHEFHNLIIQGSDNIKLAEHYRALMNQLAYHRIVVRTVSNAGRLSSSLEEHERVLARIMDKDRFGAEAAMRDHVRAAAREAVLR
ncbi:GntR family transcriptional regulator [Planosporangium flavigriseum]|nr:GntR family transcriptional regulator [Planosporangium flavigriseum]